MGFLRRRGLSKSGHLSLFYPGKFGLQVRIEMFGLNVKIQEMHVGNFKCLTSKILKIVRIVIPNHN